MAKKEFKTLDDVLEEQNRLMKGKPFDFTKEEMEAKCKEMT